MAVPANLAGAGDPSLSAAWISTANNNPYSIWISGGGVYASRCLVPMDLLSPEYYHDIAEFYLEAAHRLPIADIPYLADCISNSGLATRSPTSSSPPSTRSPRDCPSTTSCPQSPMTR
jgi:hypothetical protein